MPGCPDKYIVWKPEIVTSKRNKVSVSRSFMLSQSSDGGNHLSVISKFSMMKYQYPPVFKDFVIHVVRSLGSLDRAALRFDCRGLIPGSMFDGDMFEIIASLVQVNELSFMNMSLLNNFLSRIGHSELLRELVKVEMRISVGVILGEYLKFRSVNGFRRGTSTRPDNSNNIVKFLFSKKQGIAEVRGWLRQLSCHNIRNFELDLNKVIRSLQLSWPVITMALVIIGELYASSFRSQNSEDVYVTEEDYFVYSFSHSETCGLLSEWILQNGGLVSKLTVLSIKTILKTNVCLPLYRIF